MSSEPVISLKNLSKCYQIYDKPRDRLLQMLVRGRKQYYREFWALKEIDFEIQTGEVIGVIGANGAGKSTLLQLVCGTLAPTSGEVSVKGRVAALLELGAGFNPDFTGRENVYLSAAVTGVSYEEISKRFEEIVDFSGISDFIDQPVKTYSSGMYVRLAFSVAINVEPDILVIDEALSVGDGEFSRKSFDCIMAMKKAGKTILFCSHALYQVEAICDKVIWLKHGQVARQGDPSKVVMAYSDFLNGSNKELVPQEKVPLEQVVQQEPTLDSAEVSSSSGTARLLSVKVRVDQFLAKKFKINTGESDLGVEIEFEKDPLLPMPHVGICFVRQDGQIVASVATHFDQLQPQPTPRGGLVDVVFPSLPLLRGSYQVDVYLMCEDGVHVYDCVNMAAIFEVDQQTLNLGIVSLPHRWNIPLS